MLAATSRPPLTADANRHTPSASQPGRQQAASKAAMIAASANRPGSAGGPIASPPSSPAGASTPTRSSGARAPNRRPHPRADEVGSRRISVDRRNEQSQATDHEGHPEWILQAGGQGFESP